MENAYVQTKYMGEILGYISDFILNNREIIFFEGEYYFTQNKRINWKISKMTDWI